MKLALALSAANLLLLGGFAITQANAAAPDVQPVVRAQLIELVDSKGQVRAQLKTEADEVIFRLRDREGQIRVKLGAGEGGSGLLLIDERTEPGVHLLAGRSAVDGRPQTGITLADARARRTLTPAD